MNALPSTWVSSALEAVSDVVRGITFPANAKESSKTDSNVCCLRTTNIQREIDWHDVYYVSREYVKRDTQLVQRGDILMSMANSYELVGKVAVASTVPCETAFGAFLSAVRPRDVILGQYLFHFLRSDSVQREIREGSSQTTNIANISVGTLSKIVVPLAPIDEQKRIADKLDSLLARVDACRDRLDRVPAILKRFRQSVVSAAVTGDLSDVEQPGALTDATAYEQWNEQSVQDLCENNRVITYGVIKLGDEIPNGVPCLRTSNVRWLRIETEGMKRIAASLSSEYTRTILRGGEVLVNVRGTLGGVAVASSEMAGWNVSREVAVVPVDATRVDPAFLAYSIGSAESQRWLSRVEKGVAYTGINIEDLRELPVRFPPIPEQKRIVARVQTLHAFADRLEARYATARDRVKRLTPALLAKAFRGELVPQDPNDEPASELLKRIEAARAAKPEKLKRGRVGKGSKQQKVESTMLSRKDVQANHLTVILTAQGPLTSETLWAASQLDIDDFYDQLKAEEEGGLLKERRGDSTNETRLLEAA